MMDHKPRLVDSPSSLLSKRRFTSNDHFLAQSMSRRERRKMRISSHPRREQQTGHLILYVLSTILLLILLVGCNGAMTTNNKTQSDKLTSTVGGQPISCTSHSSNPVTLIMYY